MSESTSRRSDLSADKLELLRRRLGGDATAAPAREVIPRCAGDGPEFPLSFAQERVWFVTQFEPGNPMYNVAGAELVRADADVRALERAYSRSVRRHEGLRTVFRVVHGQARQLVLDPFDVRIDVRDVRPRSAPGGVPDQDALLALLAEEGARPFDLGEGPLLRVALLRVSDTRCALLTTVHHLVTDGWSVRLLASEVDEAYGHYAAGREPPERAPALRYADFAVWQRGWLSGDNLARQVGYWRGALEGAPVLDLPTDRPRPAQQSFAGRLHPFGLSATQAAALRRVAREESATLNMVVLAGFAALLGRWSGQDDLVVGTILANRNRPELEEVIGFFANTAALRLRLEGAPTFRQAVREAKRAVLGADAHQELPFEKLVEELRLERDGSRHPLFQAMYFHHATVAAHDGKRGGMEELLEVEAVDDAHPLAAIDTGTAKFDLTATTMEMLDDSVTGVIEYATELFDASTVDRFARQLVTLLERAAASPDRPLAELPLMDDVERRRVVVEWNRTARPYPREAAHRLFEARAAAHPDALALRSDAASLTYGELNARANRLARRLRALGVGPEERVGVALERSPDLVVALVAVVKAGGAYVPLDPEYPPARLDDMRRDAGARVVVTRRADDVAAWAGDARVVALEAERGAIDAERGGDLAEVEVDPEGLAYVLYTSGSTGRPKGIGVPHRAVVRLVRGQEFVRWNAGEVVLQMVPTAFDVSTFEIWGPLLNGGCIAVYPPSVPEPRAVGDFVRRHGVTTAWLTAGLFHQAVDEGLPGFEGVRQLLAGGDVLSPPHVAKAMALLPEARLLDGYGPTECTTFTSCHPVRPEDVDGRAIPVGKPLANARHYVLDAGMRPLPVGVPGELYIGGDGVARGYLGRPALTAEKFVPDPFFAHPGGRLYRTGDRVRWTERGEVDFLGRLDGQVKVRGFRIELGEIESVLRAHPSVRDAVATVRGEGAGRRLAAYVTPPEVDVAAVREHAAERLPEYMVPAAVVALDTLPLTPNGKVDRRALPEPDFAAVAELYIAPVGPTEEALAVLWAELLGVARVGAGDSFFTLGGHSLLAMRMAAEVLERLEVEVSLRVVFEAPRLRELATRIDRLRDEALAALLEELGGEILDDDTRTLLEL